MIMILFLKDRKSNGSKDESSLKSEQKRGGLEFNLLLRKPYFWLSLVCVFLSGLILQGTESISAMHLKDVGIDYSNVKNVLSFGSLFLAFSKLFSGFLYDKRGLRLSATMCSFFAVVSSIVLVMTENNSIGLALAVVYAIISKFASPLCTVMLTVYATDLCGERAYIKALGIYVSVNTVGYAISAPAMNICYDMLGNYNLALYLSAIGMTAVLVILQYVISASHKDQRNLSTV